VYLTEDIFTLFVDQWSLFCIRFPNSDPVSDSVSR